jgi:hypothetical protein
MLQSETAPLPEPPATNPRDAWLQKHRVFVWDRHWATRSKRGMNFHAARSEARYPECYIQPVGKGKTVEGALRSLARKIKSKLPPK